MQVRTDHGQPSVLQHNHTIVIVLGNVRQSPPMQYHAISLLEHGHSVSLVGYEGEDLIPKLHEWSSSSSSSSSHNDETTKPSVDISNNTTRAVLNVVRFNPYCPQSIDPPLFEATLPSIASARFCGRIVLCPLVGCSPWVSTNATPDGGCHYNCCNCGGSTTSRLCTSPESTLDPIGTHCLPLLSTRVTTVYTTILILLITTATATATTTTTTTNFLQKNNDRDL